MNDLTTELDQLAISAQAHYAEAEAHLAGFIEASLAVGDDMLRGRELCGSDDNMFNEWLKKAGLDHINSANRAAYINMAKNREVSAKVLAETTLTSPRYIWEREIQPKIGYCQVTIPPSGPSEAQAKIGYRRPTTPPTEPPITRREDTVRPRVLMSPPSEEHSMQTGIGQAKHMLDNMAREVFNEDTVLTLATRLELHLRGMIGKMSPTKWHELNLLYIKIGKLLPERKPTDANVTELDAHRKGTRS